MQGNEIVAPSLMTRPMTEAKTTLSKSAIYARINPSSPDYDPDFPKPIQIGQGRRPRVAWLSAEIDAWIEKKVEQSRGCKAGAASSASIK